MVNLIDPISFDLIINTEKNSISDKHTVFEKLKKAYTEKINIDPLLTNKESKNLKKGFINKYTKGFKFPIKFFCMFAGMFGFLILNENLRRLGFIPEVLSLCFMFFSWIYMIGFALKLFEETFSYISTSLKIKTDIIKFTLSYLHTLEEHEKKELIDELYQYENGKSSSLFEKLECIHIKKQNINTKIINQNLTTQEKIDLLENKYVK